jgi:TolA-binding protein
MFPDEQLKRIAEFGRVHANLVKEAKEYVAGIETQLKEQFERERESLTRQAEAYVAQFQQENDQLRQRVQALEEELEDLQQDDEQEEEEEEEEMEATDAEATMETMESGSPILDVALDGLPASGGDSTDDSSMASHSPDLLMTKQSVNSTRVDAVAETMQRAMEIQTTSPTEDVTRRSASPTTTHEGSPIDANDGPRRTTTPKDSSTSGTPPPEMASTEYL